MPDNIDDIASIEMQTDEDVISGNFCECGHLLDEHFVGSITGIAKCHALIFNGAVWSSCRCSKLVPFQFNIKVMVPDYADNTQIAV